MTCKFRELVEKHSLAEISSDLYAYIIWNILFQVKMCGTFCSIIDI